jgi:hypothetical protein
MKRVDNLQALDSVAGYLKQKLQIITLKAYFSYIAILSHFLC